jgi:transcriptional regulator with XRE-family HTH domain
MTYQSVPFGVLLRRWRLSRRMTQTDLALAANSSTRHLSCLETARSQPSREMVLRLCEHLEVPLRDQNALLLAAGFAPAFQERSLGELASARVAIDRILRAHMLIQRTRWISIGTSSFRTARSRSFTRAAPPSFCESPSMRFAWYSIRWRWDRAS